MNKSSFFIVGKHPVIEALKNSNRKVLRVFLTEESKKTIQFGRAYSFKQRGNKKTARSSEISAFTKKCMLVKNFEMIKILQTSTSSFQVSRWIAFLSL